MSAPHPRMHGLTHVPGGPDPVPGLLPPQTAGNFPAQILALPDLRGYWRLGEGSSPYADTSGNAMGPHNLQRNLGTLGGTSVPMTEDVTPGLLPPETDDGAVAFNQDEPEPSPQREFLENPTVSGAAQFNFSGTHTMSVVAMIQPGSATHTFWGGAVGDMNGAAALNGWGLRVRYPTLEVDFLRAQDATHYHSATAPPVTAGETVMVVGTYDGALIRLYVNGVLAASVADTSSLAYSGSNSVRVGGFWWDLHTYSTWQSFYGVIDEVAVYGSVLSDSDVAALYQTGAAVQPGDVLTLDENGNPVWAPPTVEITGGGVNPAPVDETPADSSHPAGSGPTTSSGWHLDAHVETVVLHDPNPGRFDVPTMKWVRVPFTSITIYRTWEPTVDAEILKTARLKDDRGLMQAAKNGILHINPDMAWPDAPPMNIWIDDAIVLHPEQHHVEGWFSIEYPVLDARYLPENDIELLTLGPTPPAPRPGVDVLPADGYQRGSRFMNLSTGSVLRSHAGSTGRAIANWWFWGEAEISTGAGDGPGTGSPDNPFPIWGDWPARPIHMTPPYPQMNPTDSRAYYQDSVGMAGYGFGPYRGLEAGTNLSAGANLCMQAWQDSPWLLRFSTARFPAYRGFDADYNGFPHLAVTYHYDPDTINHTTGKLLLPAT